MENYIIAVIVTIAITFGIYSAIKHFKGQGGGCCGGGGTVKAKRKKLKNILYRKTFKVEGMHCDNCKKRVEEIINDISGLAGRVDLKNNELTVSYAKEIDDSVIISRLERAGYGIKE